MDMVTKVRAVTAQAAALINDGAARLRRICEGSSRGSVIASEAMMAGVK